jgi:hypothetical protein
MPVGRLFSIPIIGSNVRCDNFVPLSLFYLVPTGFCD